MKIAMVTSEANPLCKSGGLADVAYSLSRELNTSGNNAFIILPYYKKIKNNNKIKVTFIKNFNINMSWRTQYCGVFETKIDGILFYLVDNEYYFNRDNLYGYGDDGERFAFFSLAALEIIRQIALDTNIVHVHDWQGGMIPCLIKERFRDDCVLGKIKTVLTIHNPAFKGFLNKYFLNNFYGLQDYVFDNGNVRFDDMVSTLKAAITYADMITTVSPTHRNELLTNELSHKLNRALELRKDDFVGIVNGIDLVEFNPKDDKRILANYHSGAFVLGKSKNKKDLLSSFYLPQTNGPVFGLVSRLTNQKGIDLILKNLDYVVSKGGKVIILGSGEYELEQQFEIFRAKHPFDIGIYIGYNDNLAHKVYAGSDFFLMPSLFEPCGIGQIIAQRYGSLPIVRKTGGLVDTVTGYDGANIDCANGLSFDKFDSFVLGQMINVAFDIYNNKVLKNHLVKNAMNLDRSWKSSMNEYVKVYRKALEK